MPSRSGPWCDRVAGVTPAAGVRRAGAPTRRSEIPAGFDPAGDDQPQRVDQDMAFAALTSLWPSLYLETTPLSNSVLSGAGQVGRVGRRQTLLDLIQAG